jgi:hypothetical protein
MTWYTELHKMQFLITRRLYPILLVCHYNQSLHQQMIKKMKTTNTQIKKLGLLLLVLVFNLNLKAQEAVKPVAAILGIDSKGTLNNSEAVSFMVRLEVEKSNVYTMMDKYDVAELIKKNGIDVSSCYGKSCVLAAGKSLGVDKMITGSVERFGEKIIISLKVIDVKTEEVEKQNTTEYQNIQPEMQKMIAISVQKLFGLPVNQDIVDILVNYDGPIATPQTQVKLNGPRMGSSMAFGEANTVMQAPKSEGGFDMYPATFQIGWQFEKQYISAGNFQALVEFIPMIGGLESGKIIPSATFLNGFRAGKGGWEIAFGPSFRIVSKANGFYDSKNTLGEGVNKWHLEDDWASSSKNPNPIVSRLDSRGNPTLSTSLFIGVGRTFKSGYLNIPVNLYVLPNKHGTIAGFSFGFNIYRKPRII